MSAARDYGIGLGMFLASVLLARAQRMQTQTPMVGEGVETGSGAALCVTGEDGRTVCAGESPSALDELLGGVDKVIGTILSWAPTSSPSGGGASDPFVGTTGPKPEEQHPGYGYWEEPDR